MEHSNSDEGYERRETKPDRVLLAPHSLIKPVNRPPHLFRMAAPLWHSAYLSHAKMPFVRACNMGPCPRHAAQMAVWRSLHAVHWKTPWTYQVPFHCYLYLGVICLVCNVLMPATRHRMIWGKFQWSHFRKPWLKLYGANPGTECPAKSCT